MSAFTSGVRTLRTYGTLIGLSIQLVGAVAIAYWPIWIPNNYLLPWGIGLFAGGMVIVCLGGLSVWKKITMMFVSVLGLLIIKVVISLSSMYCCYFLDSVFVNHGPRDDAYQRELARQIKACREHKFEKIVYRYKETVQPDHIKVYVHSKHICAIAYVQMDHWGKLRWVKRGGKSFGHAGLAGFKFDIVEAQEEVKFVFKGVNDIID